MVRGRLEIRAHHGMCLAFFEGKGYSEEFAEHMQMIHDSMEYDPELYIVTREDIICEKCPNLQDGICKTRELVREYDRRVLECCGLKENAEISWNHFSSLVSERILAAGKRESICGNCMWTEICKLKK